MCPKCAALRSHLYVLDGALACRCCHRLSYRSRHILHPAVTRAAVLREPGVAEIGQWAIIQAVAQSLGVELKPIMLSNAGEIERAVTTFAREPNGGVIVVVSAASLNHRDLIVGLAARHRLPTVYTHRVFVTGGALISYAPDIVTQYRRVAGYVDRILKGEKPADLPAQVPVEQPTKFDLVINLAL